LVRLGIAESYRKLCARASYKCRTLGDIEVFGVECLRELTSGNVSFMGLLQETTFKASNAEREMIMEAFEKALAETSTEAMEAAASGVETLVNGDCTLLQQKLQSLVYNARQLCTIQESLVSLANRSYGKWGERECIKHWNKYCSEPDFIETVPTIQTVPWFPGACLRGRPDGYTKDGRVVEIKFRLRGFTRVGHIRLAERIQMHCYMFMSKSDQCVLIEGINAEGCMLLRHNVLDFDAGFWQRVTAATERLHEFRQQLLLHSLFRCTFQVLETEGRRKLLMDHVNANRELVQCVSDNKRKRGEETEDES